MSSPRPILEIAVDSLEDAIAACQQGADRLELVADLHTQGLTAPASLIREVVAACPVPVMAMVRPREGDFCMSAAELLTMQRDAEAAIEAGARGIVFGVQAATGHVALSACRELMAVCRGEGRIETVFHRAFDFTPDGIEACETLIHLGVTRILSAGVGTWATPGAGEALAKRCERLRELIEVANGRIEILPGGGVRPSNAREVIRSTGCTQLHSACRPPAAPIPCHGSPRLDPSMVRAMRAAMDG